MEVIDIAILDGRGDNGIIIDSFGSESVTGKEICGAK
jgi:hypothetical protein